MFTKPNHVYGFGARNSIRIHVSGYPLVFRICPRCNMGVFQSNSFNIQHCACKAHRGQYLSRTDHNKHSVRKYKMLHKYEDKFNSATQIMIKRLTLIAVILLSFYSHSIQYMVDLHTTFITHRIVKQLQLSIIYLDHYQACIKTSKMEKMHIMLHNISGLQVLTKHEVHKY